MCFSDIFLGLLALLFPPLPVWVKRGICSADSIINILLCMLGFIPGLIHAWYTISKYPEPPCEYSGPQDAEFGRGHVYVFVAEDGSRHPLRCPPQSLEPASNSYSKNSNFMSYGTTVAAPEQNSSQSHSHYGDGGNIRVPPPSYTQVVAGDHKIQTQE